MDGPHDRWVLDLTTVLEAPRETVFSALTHPVTLARWWGPAGFSLPEVDLDLQVGGRYRFSMQPPDGTMFHLAGEFLTIEPPDRLAYTFRWEEPDPDDRETVVSLSLEVVEHATKVILSQGDFTTQERLELHRSGWADSFERLREVLASDPSRTRARPD